MSAAEALTPEQSTLEVRESLTVTEKGQPANTIGNCRTVFCHDPLLRDAIRLNLLTDRVDIVRDLGWRRDTSSLTDTDVKYLLLYFEQNYGLTSEKKMTAALSIVANENCYHPIRDVLNGLVWDGTPRIRSCLHHFLGADQSDYVEEMMKHFLLGAIRRVFSPGSKYEEMLCLVGGQGAGKSSFFRLLAIRDEWFSDDLKKLDDDRVYLKLQGHWIIEMSEMLATSSAKSIEEIRSFISRQKETYRTVYTSAATGGAMRGYGIPQSVFFAECLTDDICRKIGADPLKFRMENCVPEGFVDPGNGIGFHSYGLKKCMEAGAEYIHWDEKREKYKNQTGPVRRGVGMAIFCYKTGVHPISLETASCRMILNQDGSMQLSLGATEIGQGADTVFTQMAAETTGLSFENVYVVSTQDTDTAPFDTGAYASRQSYVSGMAVKKCGIQFKEKLLDYAAYMLNSDTGYLSATVYAETVRSARKRLNRILGLREGTEITADMLDVADSRIVCAAGGEELFPLSVLADTAFYSLDRSVHITAECTNQCRKNTFSSGCCFVEVEVDLPLGLVEVKDIVNVHDSGKLLNPKLAEAQVHGGMSMGLGYGLSEELLFSSDGRPLNPNLLDYKIPTAMDTPKLNVKFIELVDPTGPYGNKSLGEPPAIPVAPALRNAVLHATGVAMDELPMTPQRLIAAFQEHGLLKQNTPNGE